MLKAGRGSHFAIICDNFEAPIAKRGNIKHVIDDEHDIVALEKAFAVGSHCAIATAIESYRSV